MEWKNWSGNVVANPTEVHTPRSEQEVVTLVNRIIKEGKKVRVVGSGHSFSKVAASNQVLVSLDEMQGLIEYDKELKTATIWGGTKLKQLGELLFEIGLAQENLGDIDVQSVAGAISTGTHGTGSELQSLSNQILGLTLVNGKGELLTITGADTDLLNAAKLSLGTIGIITRVKLQLTSAYKLEETTKKESFEDCMNQMDTYIRENRNFEFFWFPHTELVQTKFLNESDKPLKQKGAVKKLGDRIVENWLFRLMSTWVKWFPICAKSLSKVSAWGISNGNYIDWSHKIYATPREVKFNEMEYNVPIEHCKDVLLELKEMISTQNILVHFPVECRFVKADELMISPAYKRDAAYIAVHQYKGMAFRNYFSKAEAIFRKYNGRPHWGKINFLTKECVQRTYPRWQDFKTIRDYHDPNRIFLNEYLEKIF